MYPIVHLPTHAASSFLLLPLVTITLSLPHDSIQTNSSGTPSTTPVTLTSTNMMSSFQRKDDALNEEDSYKPTSTNFHPRYTGPPPNEMTSQQLSIRQSILSSRPHTGLSGPFGPWLANPAIASPSQELGRVVRYETSLSRRESELVILLTGAKFQSETEFDLHVGEARRVGLGWEVIRSIPRGIVLSSSKTDLPIDTTENDNEQKPMSEEKFSFERVKESVIPLLIKEHEEMQITQEEGGALMANVNVKEREVAIVLFVAELLDSNTVSDETYSTARRVLGGHDAVLVEITAIVGYYAYVSYTLNVFQIPS